MHKTHIFDQKNNAKKIFLPTYLPYLFSSRYRKQTINFLRPKPYKWERLVGWYGAITSRMWVSYPMFDCCDGAVLSRYWWMHTSRCDIQDHITQQNHMTLTTFAPVLPEQVKTILHWYSLIAWLYATLPFKNMQLFQFLIIAFKQLTHALKQENIYFDFQLESHSKCI